MDVLFIALALGVALGYLMGRESGGDEDPASTARTPSTAHSTPLPSPRVYVPVHPSHPRHSSPHPPHPYDELPLAGLLDHLFRDHWEVWNLLGEKGPTPERWRREHAADHGLVLRRR